MLNESFIQYPPVDLLVAAYLGHKSPSVDGKTSRRDSRRANTAALKSIPTGKMKTLDQMPEYVRSPAKLELIKKMKQEMAG